jgi:flagellar biosynthesis anti-sigma factor FlgM
MRIGSSQPLLEPQAATIDKPASSSDAVSQKTGATENSDGVSFSTGTTVGDLVSRLQALPDVRQDRVTALKQAIESGKYRVSDGQIAGALQAQLLQAGSANH